MSAVPFRHSDRQKASPASSPALSSFWRLIPRLDGTASKVVTVLGEDGLVRYQSPPTQWLLGYDPDRLVGRPLTDMMHERSKDRARKAVTRMAEDGQRFDLWRFRFLLPRRARLSSSESLWMEGMASNFLKDPRLAGIMVYWREMQG